MVDIDLGPRLVSFVLLFVALPILLAVVASAAIGRRIRNATTKLAIGMYLMLVCALVSPAPILWGDDHLGFPSTQALQGYGMLVWAVGAIATLDSLSGIIRRRELLGLACGLIAAALLACGWVASIIGPGAGLALVPAAGTLGPACAHVGGPPSGWACFKDQLAVGDTREHGVRGRNGGVRLPAWAASVWPAG